jgi:TetR/AcrR family transcriptional repressor of mexJK operon
VTDAFLRNGYPGTTMDQIAAQAAVSKQTVYKHFSDKEQLFVEIILDTMGSAVDQMVRGAVDALADSDDVARDLLALAHNLIDSIWQPRVLELRRLVIAEAGRFPQLGEAYFKQGFQGGIESLAASLRQLADRGVLRVEDPLLAAQHLAGLVLWVPMNQAMFTGTDSPAARSRCASAGVDAFLAIYGRR